MTALPIFMAKLTDLQIETVVFDVQKHVGKAEADWTERTLRALVQQGIPLSDLGVVVRTDATIEIHVNYKLKATFKAI